jgi:hypothetical protein
VASRSRWWLCRSANATVRCCLATASPEFTIPAEASKWNIAADYGRIGTIHILEGVDHLLFIGVVLTAMALFRRLPLATPAGVWRVAPYSIGSLAAFWTIQRVMSFVPQ